MLARSCPGLLEMQQDAMDRNVSQQDILGVSLLMALVCRPKDWYSTELASILGAGRLTSDNLESWEEPVSQSLQIWKDGISRVLVSPSEDAKKQASYQLTYFPKTHT